MGGSGREVKSALQNGQGIVAGLMSLSAGEIMGPNSERAVELCRADTVHVTTGWKDNDVHEVICRCGRESLWK